MLRRLLGRMDPLKRNLLKSDASVPPLAFGQIMDSPWLKQIRQLSLEIEEKAQAQQNAQKAAESVENNPYYNKYAEKIRQRKAEESTKPKSVKVENEASVQSSKPDSETINAQKDQTSESTKTQPEASTSERMSMPAPKSKKSLANIMKLELLEDKTADEISEIWQQYHKSRDCIYATIPANVYQELYTNIKQYPMFILPLPRANAQVEKKDQGEQKLIENSGNECYEFFFLQSQEHAIYLTSLSAIQLHKENAPVTMTIYHYPELMESKGITLMMGEYDTKVLNALEVQCLANQLQYYYTTKDPASKLTLHMFNREPKSFDHMRLIRHLEEGLLTEAIGSVDLKAQD